MSQRIFQSLEQSLYRLGLNQHEVDLYILGLKLGPTPPSILASELGITRPNIYKVIAGLEQLGLTRFSEKHGSAKNFTVESPARVAELLQKEQKELQQEQENLFESIPDLTALYQQGELPTSIRVLEGKHQFEKAFFQTLDIAKDEIFFFGSSKDFIELASPKQHQAWMELRKKKRIKVKALFFPTTDAVAINSDGDPLREMRFLQNMQPFTSSFQVFANKVIIWQPKAPLAIVIEDQYIVGMLKAMFLKLWEGSSSTPNQSKT